jgi:hypothetical protein
MKFKGKSDQGIIKKSTHIPGKTWQEYVVEIEATQLEKQSLFLFLDLIRKNKLGNTGGYDDFPIILNKLREQKDVGNYLFLHDQEILTIEIIFTSSQNIEFSHYGFSQEEYEVLKKDIDEIYQEVFEKNYSRSGMEQGRNRIHDMDTKSINKHVVKAAH